MLFFSSSVSLGVLAVRSPLAVWRVSSENKSLKFHRQKKPVESDMLGLFLNVCWQCLHKYISSKYSIKTCSPDSRVFSPMLVSSWLRSPIYTWETGSSRQKPLANLFNEKKALWEPFNFFTFFEDHFFWWSCINNPSYLLWCSVLLNVAYDFLFCNIKECSLQNIVLYFSSVFLSCCSREVAPDEQLL